MLLLLLKTKQVVNHLMTTRGLDGNAFCRCCHDSFYGFIDRLASTAGFIGKFYIFASLIKGGSTYYWLVVIGGINSVVSLYYYLKVVKVMYFEGERTDKILFPSNVLTGALIFTAVPSLFLEFIGILLLIGYKIR